MIERDIRRAVVLTATEPEPRSFGKQVSLGSQLDHLCRRLGPGQVHVLLVGDPALTRPAVPYQLHVIRGPGAPTQAWNVVRRVTAPPRTSLQEAALYSSRVAAELRSLLEQIDPDLEVYDTVRMGQYAQHLRRAGRRPFRVLHADDLFSVRYRDMLEGLGRCGGVPASPVGGFGRFFPGPLTALLRRPSVYRPLLRLEHRLVGGSELRQPPMFDRTLLVSEEEAGYLRRRLPGLDIRGLPPMLSEPSSRERQLPVRPTFAFLGGLDFAPNADGLAWFLRSSRAEMLRRLPDCRILVIGPGTARGLPEAVSWGGRVEFLGWIDDLDQLLAGCHGLLSVLRTGSGIKVKVLEALGRGLPVIATPHGIRGVEAGEAEGCMIHADSAGLVAAMCDLAEPERNGELSLSARRAWLSRFCPATLAPRYDDAFGLTVR